MGLLRLAIAGLVALCPLSAVAAIVGFHDVSDPVKTSGWACHTDSAKLVRVHLYARVNGVLRFVDSQLADQRRSDLGRICQGSGHAFRFSNYAAGELGAKLYERTSPSTMEVYVEGDAYLLSPLPGTGRNVAFGSIGLWDAGLRAGRWRTDYDNSSEGTAHSPLVLGKCQFETPLSDGYFAFSGGGYDAIDHCRYQSAVSPNSNAASSHREWPSDSFWAVIANVEDALLNPNCTTGPPSQSLPLMRPGEGGVFGIVALPDTEAGRPDRMKMHMVLNSENWGECRKSSYGGPYMSVGAQTDRGNNNGILTYLNKAGEPTRFSFAVTLMDVDSVAPVKRGASVGAKRYGQSHVLIEATWGGIKRWVFIELVPDVRLVPGTNQGWADVHVRFNWHMYNSMLYPGADYIYKSATVLSTQCAVEKIALPVLDRSVTYVNPATRAAARREYSIDIQAVFECLERRGEWGASPMPKHPIPVTGLSFGVEQDDRYYLDGVFTGVVGPNTIWIAIDSVRLN